MGDPTTATGFWDRWRASDLSGANGLQIGSWSSPGGKAVTQGVAADQPLLQTDAQSRRYVSFDGSTDRMLLTTPALLNAKAGATMYCVVSIPSYGTTTTHNMVFISSGASAGSARLGSRVNAQKLGGGARRLDADGFAAIEKTDVNAPTASKIVLSLVADYSLNPGALTLFLDGTQANTVTTTWASNGTATLTSATDPLHLAFGTANTTGFAAMDLYETLIYEASHSAADRANVHSYIQDTYGITVADYPSSVPFHGNSSALSAMIPH